MKQNLYKEVVPVFYGENLVKLLHCRNLREGQVCINHHYHDRMELLRIRSGSITLNIAQKHLEAHADELVIINPGQSHAGIAATDGVNYDVIMFDLINLNNHSYAFQKYLEPIIQQEIAFTNVTDQKELLDIADAIIHSYTEKQSVHSLRTIGMIYDMLGAFYQYCTVTEDRLHSTARISDTNAVTSYIRAHFTEPMSTKTLSETFGYNDAYFSRKFKRDTGMSVTHYIETLRIEYAQKLLRETGESIVSIALKSGFSDVCYFSHRFKKHTEKTPTEYRHLISERKNNKASEQNNH